VDREFLYRLEDELTRKLHEINERNMGIQELRDALNASPDLEISYQEFEGGNQLYTINGNEIWTRRGIPIEAVVEAYLNNSHGMASPFLTNETSMSITGLKAGAFHGTIEALRQRLIDKQSQGAAKIAAAGEAGAVKIDEAVNNAEAKIDKEVSEVLQDFSEFTNGGPV
jgi:hypothetical protein